MAAIAWYGPLIDLSDAASHLDDFVQLIVFVHRSQPIQKSSGSRKGKLLKTDIQVGDNTRSYFSISVWQKHLWSMIVAGDIIFLQNVKIVKFRDILEASTVQATGVQVLINSYKFTTTKANTEIEANCSLGERTREKLRRVAEWVRLTESATLHLQPVNAKCQPLKNWKSHEEKELNKYLFISELPYLSKSSSANFYAWINKISYPSTGRHGATEDGQLFHSGRLTMLSDFKAEDLICTGCTLCGSPLDSRYIAEGSKISLDCMENSKYLHDVCFIYRPFLGILITNHGIWCFVGHLMISLYCSFPLNDYMNTIAYPKLQVMETMSYIRMVLAVFQLTQSSRQLHANGCMVLQLCERGLMFLDPLP